ncbi:MAG: xanthine dehydrogenase small subunit [Betaproteobacteria bacterium]
MRQTLDFFLNGERLSLADEDPRRTVLTWLRERQRLAGTKEGCAEGDCGACTAVVAELDPAGRLRYLPVNTCIMCVGALDGRELITVEALRRHPVQQAMVDCHGSQCGFCTPGFVMALYAHYQADGSAEREALCDAIAGNLCRCTGYRPILEAGERAIGLRGDLKAEHEERRAMLASLPATSALVKGFAIPATADQLADFLARNPHATILAGGTDVGLVITKQHQDLPEVAYTGRVADLKSIDERPAAIEIGGGVTYAQAYAALGAIHPDIGELVRRLGAAQVRATGTLAGNIANGSPIGDSMPVLLALDAVLTLQRGKDTKEVKLAEFYTGYRKSVLQPGELIRSIRVPKLPAGARFAAYKLTKRIDQDISAVCGAFYADGSTVRFGYGGMAATPARAPKAEAAWPRGLNAACAALAEDFKPMTDQRASSWYRLTTAQNLLRKFHAGIGARALMEVTA